MLVVQIVGYLLQHPVAALVAGGGAAVLIPRLVRFGFRFVVIPAVLVLIAWIAFNNPASAYGAASGLFSSVLPPQTHSFLHGASSNGCAMVEKSTYTTAAKSILSIVTTW